MPLPEPHAGLVVSYAYLWQGEQEQGREEGTKDRPCVVILAVKQEGNSLIVTVAPITHTPPRQATDGIELPAATKARLRLDDQRSWIVTTEVNRFRWPGPDLRQVPNKPGEFAYGLLPKSLIIQLREQIYELGRARQLKTVNRDQEDPQNER